MTPRHARHLARAADAVAVLMGLGGLALFVLLVLPLPRWTPPAFDPGPSSRPAPEAPPAASLNDLAVIWQRDLRQPVVDVIPAGKPVTPEPALGIELVATAVEPDRRYGAFKLAGGATVVKSLGDRLEGWEIVLIERGRVRLSSAGRDRELRVPWFERIQAEAKD